MYIVLMNLRKTCYRCAQYFYYILKLNNQTLILYVSIYNSKDKK